MMAEDAHHSATFRWGQKPLLLDRLEYVATIVTRDPFYGGYCNLKTFVEGQQFLFNTL
jgi:hypothetical protein